MHSNDESECFSLLVAIVCVALQHRHFLPPRRIFRWQSKSERRSALRDERRTSERERYHDDVCVIQSDRLTIRHGILSALGGVKKMGARTSYSFVIGWGFVALIKAKLASSMTKPFIWRTIGEVVFKIALVEEFMLSSHFIRPLA
jgi:hypothetical protein